MPSMPASRRARATTLAPRSWPSSPTFPTSTRIRRSAIPSSLLLHQFHQDPGSSPGMEKADQSLCPWPGLLIDKLHLAGSKDFHLLGDTIGSEGDVVDSLAPSRQEAAHGGIGAQRLQELQEHLPQGQEGYPHPILGQLGDSAYRQAQGVPIEAQAILQAIDGDGDVVDLGDHFAAP